jgi:hypothetical protein
MNRTFVAALCVLASLPLFAASRLDQASILSDVLSSRDNIHQTVLALEEEPLHKNAELVRTLLAGYYKNVDYIICGDILGPLSGSKKHAAIMWQIIIASGDWVEANPERAKDIDAYTLAGLESGLRAYKNLLKVKPKDKSKLLDKLLARYESGTLNQWNLEHPCRAN